MSMRAVAQRYDVSLSTVQRWRARAGTERLDRVRWDDRSHAPHHSQRTASSLEADVLHARQALQVSPLGEYGAEAIHRALAEAGQPDLPTVRTIHRILQRGGALDAVRRTRRPAPPPGWYLPDLRVGQVELDSFDFVEGLVIERGPHLEILNGVSLHGGLVGSWAGRIYTAAATMGTLLAHWRLVGLPSYAQFDNDTRFQGPHQHRDVVSRVMRLCLSLGVTPVFAPPREHGFQNAVENLNGRWQKLVWSRFHHTSIPTLQTCSDQWVTASRGRRALRLEAAPPRMPVPPGWELDLQAHPTGRLVFLRRTNDQGTVTLLGRRFPVDALWPHRLVRCELHLDAHLIRFYRLRRRDPEDQPLIHEAAYALPHRRFRE
jgi:hypothetical protein